MGRYMVILALAAMVGYAQAPTPTTPPAATPAVVGLPTAQATPTGPHDKELVEQSAETRFQLDLQLSDAALAQFTPYGWSSYAEPSGAARDANLCVIDSVTVNNPTGQPMGTNGNRLVQLVAPVKDPSGTTAMLVVGGMTEDPADVPGPFGNCLQTGMHKVTRSTSDSGSGSIVDSQDWVFEGTSGEHLELHAAYDRGTAAQAPTADTSFYWAGTHRFTRSRGRNKS